MPSNLFRRPPRDAATSASARCALPCGGECHVTLPLAAFHAFVREVTRFSRSQGIRVARGFSRPIDLLRLLFGDGHDPSGALSRALFLLPRDGALHVGLRFVALERLADRSRVWIFASGFAACGPRRPEDLATRLRFGDDRVRYLKAGDLRDYLAALRLQCAGDLEPDLAASASARTGAGSPAADSFPVPEMR